MNEDNDGITDLLNTECARPHRKELPLPSIALGPSPLRWLCLLGVFFGPPLLASAFLMLNDWSTKAHIELPEVAGVAELVLTIAVGAVSVLGLPIPFVERLVLTVLYVPIAGVAVVLYSLYFVGFVFGQWL